jgi:hypothetical protein
VDGSREGDWQRALPMRRGTRPGVLELDGSERADVVVVVVVVDVYVPVVAMSMWMDGQLQLKGLWRRWQT